jgi:hypothetical protein
MTLADYADRFKKLRRNKSGEHYSPHKPVMLLAIMDLIESGQVVDNLTKALININSYS